MPMEEGHSGKGCSVPALARAAKEQGKSTGLWSVCRTPGGQHDLALGQGV